MSEPRLRTGLWVAAAALRAGQQGVFALVIRRGDEEAGGVLAVLRDHGGRFSVLSQTRDAEGRQAWLRGTGAEAVDEETANAYVARQTARDPDLWVVEFDGPTLMPPFEAKLL